MANPTLQSFTLARLKDFSDCRAREERDPVSYLLDKLLEIEPLLYSLKQQLFEDAVAQFLRLAEARHADSRALEGFIFLLQSYLAPGDFVDAVFDLTPERLGDSEARSRLAETLPKLAVRRILDEEGLPASGRPADWDRLAAEFCRRLDFERLERIALRRPKTGRRLRYILRRAQYNVGEYCTVLRHPRGPEDLFTPFITPRIEGLIAACRRFLRRLPKEP
ncbi:MAG: hypothetical protein WCI75_13755 [candidate division NC10 bacterium]